MHIGAGKCLVCKGTPSNLHSFEQYLR